MGKRKETSTNYINEQELAHCPVNYTIGLIGGRWKTVILYNLFTGTKRFGELRKLLPGVTEKMLTQQLRELERDGLVDRKVYLEVPPKVEYSLSTVGKTLSPIMGDIAQWGLNHLKNQGQISPKKKVA